MDASNVFEAFNHFLSTRDTSQLLAMADDVEVFSSTTFGDGRTYIGRVAPAKFRETIAVIRAVKPEITADVVHALIGNNTASFFLNITRGRKTSSSALKILVRDGKLRSFHETVTKF